jgi:hypothetical protein
MSAILRHLVRLGLVVVCIAVVALGVLWLRDRGRQWDRPRWPDVSFVALRAGPVDEREPISVIAVHPGCPHCMSTVARLARGWSADHPGERLAALIIDCPRRPPERVWRAIPIAAVWWDRRDVWRARWGHRLYGERLCFDAGGRYRTTHAAVAMDSGDHDDAPADTTRGGSE